MANCPECGGKQVAGKDCQSMLEDMHAWEWQIPELGALHFVFVAAYLLQHPSSLTPEAYSLLADSFTEHLNGNLGIDEIRRRHAQAIKGVMRVRRPEGDRGIVPRSWQMTIADAHGGTQTGVADRVMTWAKAVRLELTS